MFSPSQLYWTGMDSLSVRAGLVSVSAIVDSMLPLVGSAGPDAVQQLAEALRELREGRWSQGGPAVPSAPRKGCKVYPPRSVAR
jgi:hypothetical protein